MIYIELFLAFMYVATFTLGGGYAALPLIEEQVVHTTGWLSALEFSDLITISQITPGPIGINAATFVGTKVAGFPGAVAATAGFIIPPFVISTIFYFIYRKYRKMTLMQGVMSGLRPAVVALIAAAGLSILITALWGENGISGGSFSILSLLLTMGALVALKKFKADQIVVIFSCGIIFAAVEFIKQLL